MRSTSHGPLEQAAGRAVRDYLEALRSPVAGAASRASIDDIHVRLAEIHDELPSASPVRELKLVQERHELVRILDFAEHGSLQAREDAFVAVAAIYSRRHHIDYATWREVGVPASVLRRAGLRPVSRRAGPGR